MVLPRGLDFLPLKLPKTVAVEVAMECGSAKRTRLAAKEAHVYPVTLDPGQVTVTEQLIFAGECAKEAAAAERALMMTAQAAGDQTKIETLAAANRRRADENADKIAADQTKINSASSLCGADGCGKGNIGQFESTTPAAMRQHCATKKHTVLDYAQSFALLSCLLMFIATSVTTEKYIVFKGRTESCSSP